MLCVSFLKLDCSEISCMFSLENIFNFIVITTYNNSDKTFYESSAYEQVIVLPKNFQKKRFISDKKSIVLIADSLYVVCLEKIFHLLFFLFKCYLFC